MSYKNEDQGACWLAILLGAFIIFAVIYTIGGNLTLLVHNFQQGPGLVFVVGLLIILSGTIPLILHNKR